MASAAAATTTEAANDITTTSPTTPSREERLKKREESRGDAFQSLDDNNGIVIEEHKDHSDAADTIPISGNNEEDVEGKKSLSVAGSTSSLLDKSKLALVAPQTGGELRMTRRTVQDLSQGTLFFKLGQEGSYKSYVNQYASMPAALSKVHANEERIKRTHMSHKFSLTELSAFKWLGTLHGNRSFLITTLRQTMLQLENSVPTIFMHPNWGLLRKPWIGAASQSTTPRDFARALTVLQCCMKPCIFVTIWTDQLGHTQMKKIYVQLKEEKKKSERREKKEKEDEEERLRPWMTFVKYTLGLKHQVSKQRGEEYRAHGQFGWLWLSSTRNFSPCDARKCGLRAGPHRLAVKYSDIRDGTSKIVLMEPKAFGYLVSKQDEMDTKELVKKDEEEAMEETAKSAEEKSADDGSSSTRVKNEGDGKKKEKQEEVVSKTESVGGAASTSSSPATAASSPSDDKSADKQAVEKKRLEEALKNARLQKQDIPKELYSQEVDVCAGLSNPTRVLYPKVAKKAKFLDDFLSRRLQLKTLEERRIEIKSSSSAPAATAPPTTSFSTSASTTPSVTKTPTTKPDADDSSSRSGSAIANTNSDTLSASSTAETSSEKSLLKTDDKANEEMDVDIEGESDTKTSMTSSLANNVAAAEKELKVAKFVDLAKQDIWIIIDKLKVELIPTPQPSSSSSSSSDGDHRKEEVEKTEEEPMQVDESHSPASVDVKPKIMLPCYSFMCREKFPDFRCYAPNCQLSDIKKEEVKEEPVSDDAAVAAEVTEPPRLVVKSQCLQDAIEFSHKLSAEANALCLDVPRISASVDSAVKAIAELKNIVKVLMLKKEEYDSNSAMGMSPVPTAKSSDDVLAATTMVTSSSTTTTVTTKTSEKVTTTINGTISNVTKTTTNSVTQSKITAKENVAPDGQVVKAVAKQEVKQDILHHELTKDKNETSLKVARASSTTKTETEKNGNEVKI